MCRSEIDIADTAVLGKTKMQLYQLMEKEDAARRSAGWAKPMQLNHNSTALSNIGFAAVSDLRLTVFSFSF